MNGLTGIRYARLVRGFSQLELAKKTGISNSRLCLAEKGWKGLKQTEIEKIAEILKVSTEELNSMKSL